MTRFQKRAAEHSLNVWRMAFGLLSFVHGLVLVVQTFVKLDDTKRERILRSLWCTPVAVAITMQCAATHWLLARPLEWVGLKQPEFRSFLQVSAYVVLMVLRLLLPRASGDLFFAVLATRDAALAVSVEKQAIVWGLRQKALHGLVLLFFAGVAIAVVAVVFVAFGHLVLPALAGLGLALVASWGVILGIVAVIVVSALLLGGVGYIYVLLSPFLKIWKFDPMLCVIALVMVAMRACSTASIIELMRTAVLMYYSCTILTAELLLVYAERLDRDSWMRFQKSHCWQLLGFGLPIWLLMNTQPLLVVVFMQAFIGAAAGLLADLLEADADQAALGDDAEGVGEGKAA
eukprot:TRINITY_DN29225_c0_g1_i1.p1 TRINITY_DN29225_c0_g1~~TRINITY_DN29225_c0_g1_i1.p1  ORF type:complete len:346 (+),score=77.70 TRINITY_DN29225_c0_g1_i1:79-1116(+)